MRRFFYVLMGRAFGFLALRRVIVRAGLILVLITPCRAEYDWNAHNEACAAFERVFVMHAAMVQHHDVMDDCKPEARTAIDAALRLAMPVTAEEPLEEIG